MNKKLVVRQVTELIEDRREMAGKDFIHFRESFGEHTTFLRLKVLVPICRDCWTNKWRMPYEAPNISADDWSVDLLLLGFYSQAIEKLKSDISEGA